MSGMGNIFDMMKNARQIMDKAKEIQADLVRKTARGSSGAGMVEATVNGVGELIDLRIDPSAVASGDSEMLAELVVAAVADGRKKANRLRDEAMREATGGIDLSALGLDPSALG